MDISFVVFLDGDGTPRLLVGRDWGEEVEHQLIVNFTIGHPHSVVLVESAANLIKYLVDCPGYNTSVFIVLGGPRNRERLSSPCLAVSHYCPIITIYTLPDNVPCTVIVDLFLTGVVEDLVELKLPGFLLIVDETATFILRNLYSDGLDEELEEGGCLLGRYRLCLGFLKQSCWWDEFGPLLLLSALPFYFNLLLINPSLSYPR